jgi:hypothetical protein
MLAESTVSELAAENGFLLEPRLEVSSNDLRQAILRKPRQ